MLAYCQSKTPSNGVAPKTSSIGPNTPSISQNRTKVLDKQICIETPRETEGIRRNRRMRGSRRDAI